MIVDWEKQFNPKNIEKLSKNEKKLMWASLGEIVFNCKEMEWTEEAINLCDVIWDNGLDIRDEFYMPQPKALRKVQPRIIIQLKYRRTWQVMHNQSWKWTFGMCKRYNYSSIFPNNRCKKFQKFHLSTIVRKYRLKASCLHVRSTLKISCLSIFHGYLK